MKCKDFFPTKGDTVFPYTLNSTLAEFRHVFPFFNLLQRLFGLRRHVSFTGSHFEFHDDAGLGHILGNNRQVEAAVPALPV